MTTDPGTGGNIGWLFVDTKVDISADVIPIQEQQNEQRLLAFTLGSFWVIMMIWATTALVDRWRGPVGDRPVRFASVIAALIMSTAWPVVLVYILMAN